MQQQTKARSSKVTPPHGLGSGEIYPSGGIMLVPFDVTCTKIKRMKRKTLWKEARGRVAFLPRIRALWPMTAMTAPRFSYRRNSTYRLVLCRLLQPCSAVQRSAAGSCRGRSVACGELSRRRVEVVNALRIPLWDSAINGVSRSHVCSCVGLSALMTSSSTSVSPRQNMLD